MNLQDAIKLVTEASRETQTLYELSDAEMVLMTQVISLVSTVGMSRALTAKLLKAAAHMLESTEEINFNGTR